MFIDETNNLINLSTSVKTIDFCYQDKIISIN